MFQQRLRRQIQDTIFIWAHVVPNHGAAKFIREWLAAPNWSGPGVRSRVSWMHVFSPRVPDLSEVSVSLHLGQYKHFVGTFKTIDKYYI